MMGVTFRKETQGSMQTVSTLQEMGKRTVGGGREKQRERRLNAELRAIICPL